MNDEVKRTNTEWAQHGIKIQRRSRYSSAIRTDDQQEQLVGCEQKASKAASIPSVRGRIFPVNLGANEDFVAATTSQLRSEIAQAKRHRPTNCRITHNRLFRDIGRPLVEWLRRRSNCRNRNPDSDLGSPAVQDSDRNRLPGSTDTRKKRPLFHRTAHPCTRCSPCRGRRALEEPSGQ